MELKKTNLYIFEQLRCVLEMLPDSNYSEPLAVLSGSSTGQHIRHILEFYQCLMEGYEYAEVNYDARKRDLRLEVDRQFAMEKLRELEQFVIQSDNTKALVLHYSYDIENAKMQSVVTSLNRELVYNVEHAIHHMAIIKIGVLSSLPDFTFPDNFGVASSTVRHQQHVHGNLSAS